MGEHDVPPVIVRQIVVLQQQRDQSHETIAAVDGGTWVTVSRRFKLNHISTLFILFLLCTLVLPTRTYAVGPTLVSSEYEIRSLKVGTVQHATGRPSEYELAWQQYQFLAIDLIFDQPLYISSARSIAGQQVKSGNIRTRTQSPISPHQSNHTTLPDLDQSIILECGEQSFVLNNEWKDNYWSDPSPTLLPLYSPHNLLKDDLVQLFDRRIDAKGRKKGSALFTTTTAATQAITSVVGRPNVLSLMVMMSYANMNETSGKRFLDYATSENSTSPMSHCQIQYVPIRTRQAQARAELDELALVREEEQSQRNNTQDDSIQVELDSIAGLTNFKGHEVTFPASKLTLRPALTSAFIPERSLIRIAEGLEQDFPEFYEEASEPATTPTTEDEPLYAHSPLDAEKNGPSSTPSNSASSPVVTPAFDEDDPFGGNILLDVTAGTEFVNLILRPICHGVLRPATKGTTDLLLDDIMTELGENMFTSVVDEVAPDLNIMLGLSIQSNVTNILQDSLTYAITKSLTQAINANVSPYVIKRLISNLPGPLHTIIQAILEKKIPDRLERTMPVILGRVLGVTLTHSLTRSIPHVVVPSVSHSLGLNHAGSFARPKAYYEVCLRCYMQSIGKIPPVRMSPPDLNPDGYDSGVGSGGQKAGSECGACPTSTYSMYYGIYHAAYFTDYYTEYYAEYYAKAMEKTDEAMYADDGAAHGTGGAEGGGGGGGDGDGGGGGDGGDGGGDE